MKTTLKEQRKTLRFGNGRAELAIDRASGHFLDIRNNATALSHKLCGNQPSMNNAGAARTQCSTRVGRRVGEIGSITNQ